MTGYVIETLSATGWKRSNFVQFRYRDAVETAERMLLNKLTRKVRVLPVRISNSPVFEREPSDDSTGKELQGA